jgi:hypothetical protein
MKLTEDKLLNQMRSLLTNLDKTDHLTKEEIIGYVKVTTDAMINERLVEMDTHTQAFG